MPARDDDLRERYLDLNGWIMSRTDAFVDEKQRQLDNAAVLYAAAAVAGGDAPDDLPPAAPEAAP